MKVGQIYALALLLVPSGCAEIVQFQSTPPGAKVYVDDAYVGETPIQYSTRDVILRTYSVEKEGFPKAAGELQPRIAAGRVVGAIFTLGIVAAAKPMHYYTPNPVEVYWEEPSAASGEPSVSDVKLYDLNTNEVATGTCDARGRCTVTFPSGLQCTGEFVRESRGTTKISAGRSASTGYAVGGSFGAASAGVASGKEMENAQHGVAMLQCPTLLIDCKLILDAFAPSGHGDCKDGQDGRYRLMLIPK
jgi:hypothetical protein